MAVAGDARPTSCLPFSPGYFTGVLSLPPSPCLSAENSGKDPVPSLSCASDSSHLTRGLPMGRGAVSLLFHLPTVDVAGFLSEESA